MGSDNKTDRERKLLFRTRDKRTVSSIEIARRKKLDEAILNRPDQPHVYSVITGRYPHHIEEDVRLCIEDGYEPLGGMVVEHGETTIYHQTVYIPTEARRKLAKS